MKSKILIGICLLALLYFPCVAQQDTTKIKLNQQVPEFEYEISPGIIENITDLKGKVVMITFFATWCGPCRQELPHIQSDIFNKYKNNPNFKLLIFGREHSKAEVSKFKEDNKFSMPFYADPKRVIYSKFADQFIPRTFLISTEGKVIFSSIGFVKKDFEELKEMIKGQLKKSTINP